MDGSEENAPGLDARVAGLLAEFSAMGGEEARAGMARYGIRTDAAFGVSVYELRRIAKGLGRDHDLALPCGRAATTRPACSPAWSTSRRA
jgi:3-methyladenine DNA glycosylase AlkD